MAIQQHPLAIVLHIGGLTQRAYTLIGLHYTLRPARVYRALLLIYLCIARKLIPRALIPPHRDR